MAELLHFPSTLKVVHIHSDSDLNLQLGQTIELTPLPFTLGRDPDCDLQIADPRISRKHAQIVYQTGRYAIVDLHSSNGTFVNGNTRVTDAPCLLKNLDEIYLGAIVVFKFSDPASTLTDDAWPIPRGLWVDIENQAVFVQRKIVQLTAQEFNMLSILYTHAGKVVTKNQLADLLWQGVVSDNTIDALISRLRKVLRAVDNSHQYIITERGIGFRFIQRG